MNETIKTILNRRSIRKFKDTQIKEEELYAILNAGKYAPTGFSQQPWHFTVIQNKDKLIRITELVRDFLLNCGDSHLSKLAQSEKFSLFYNAPTAIIVTAKEKSFSPIQDGTLALGNMLLAAESLGIGSCWIHSLNMALSSGQCDQLREVLNIPEGYIPVGSGVFGYNDMKAPAALPRKEDTVTIIK